MSERNESGPIRPCHIRESYRRLKLGSQNSNTRGGDSKIKETSNIKEKKNEKKRMKFIREARQ
jgi:hypothetical protein